MTGELRVGKGIWLLGICSIAQLYYGVLWLFLGCCHQGLLKTPSFGGIVLETVGEGLDSVIAVLWGWREGIFRSLLAGGYRCARSFGECRHNFCEGPFSLPSMSEGHYKIVH